MVTVMGYFQNSKSCDRIIYAIFNYFNSKWQQPRRKIKTINQLTKKAAEIKWINLFYTQLLTLLLLGHFLDLRTPDSFYLINTRGIMLHGHIGSEQLMVNKINHPVFSDVNPPVCLMNKTTIHLRFT